MKPFEILEHPADVGLRIRGRGLSELFLNAAQGLYSLLTDPESFVSASSAGDHTLELNAPDEQELLFEWLRELLFLFSARGWVLTALNVENMTPGRLRASGRIVRFDPSRHEPHLEVKAVTYHQFRLLRLKDGSWEAVVIFDI